jgi:hypothetical protein
MADGTRGHFGPAAPIRRSSRWRAACSRSPLPTRRRSRPTSRGCSGGSAAKLEMDKMSAQLRSPRVVLRLIAGLGQLMHGFATATVASKPDPLTKLDDFDGADPHRIATSGAAQHARSLPYYRQRVPSYHLDCAPTSVGSMKNLRHVRNLDQADRRPRHTRDRVRGELRLVQVRAFEVAQVR